VHTNQLQQLEVIIKSCSHVRPPQLIGVLESLHIAPHRPAPSCFIQCLPWNYPESLDLVMIRPLNCPWECGIFNGAIAIGHLNGCVSGSSESPHGNKDNVFSLMDSTLQAGQRHAKGGITQIINCSTSLLSGAELSSSTKAEEDTKKTCFSHPRLKTMPQRCHCKSCLSKGI
jgi:hypothetical protein